MAEVDGRAFFPDGTEVKPYEIEERIDELCQAIQGQAQHTGGPILMYSKRWLEEIWQHLRRLKEVRNP